jgi:hypothetical protein
MSKARPLADMTSFRKQNVTLSTSRGRVIYVLLGLECQRKTRGHSPLSRGTTLHQCNLSLIFERVQWKIK